MCGINGFNFGDEGLIRKMNEANRHRGPDATGFFVNRKISLGNNRLSIIDLDKKSNQPMEDSSSRYVIVYNGEVYNFLELRKALDPYPFRTDSDTEVVLAAYIKWGKDCVERLNGIFAFAVWDKDAEELFLARDCAGVKPMYYFLDQGKFIFSSEIKSILEHNISRTLNSEAANLYFQLFYVPAPMTMFQGIQKFPISNYGIFKKGTLSLFPYSYQGKVFARPGSKKEARQELRKIILSKVEKQMVSERPLGFFLSGGLDSNIILAAAHMAGHQKLNSFSLGFSLDTTSAEEKFNSDFNLARQSANFFKTKHHEVLLPYAEVLDLLHESVWHMDEPVSVPTALSVLKLSKYASQHVKVALAGNGGDELFAGYERYRLSHGADLYQKVVSESLRNLFGRVSTQLKKLNTTAGVSRYGLFMFQNQNNPKWLKGQCFNPEKTENFFLKLFLKQGFRENPTQALMKIDRQTWLPDQSLLISDKMSMAAGLEIRVPLLDDDVSAYSDLVPLSWKLNIFQKKILLRDAFSDVLPTFLLTQPKRGWFSPGANWLRQERVYTFVREVFVPAYYPGTEKIFNFEELQKLLELHYQKRGYFLNILWPAMIFQLWAKTFKVNI